MLNENPASDKALSTTFSLVEDSSLEFATINTSSI